MEIWRLATCGHGLHRSSIYIFAYHTTEITISRYINEQLFYYILVWIWGHRRTNRQEKVQVRRKEDDTPAGCHLETIRYMYRFQWRRDSRTYEHHVVDSFPESPANT